MHQDERNRGVFDKEKVMQTDEDEVESVPNTYPIKLNVLEVMELKSDKFPEKMVQDNSNVEANQTVKLPTVNLKVKECGPSAAGVANTWKKKGKTAWKRLAREKDKATEVQVEAHKRVVESTEDGLVAPALKRLKTIDVLHAVEDSLSAEAVVQPRRHQ